MSHPDPRGESHTAQSTTGNIVHLYQGKKLDNGATIIAARKYSRHFGDRFLAMLLCEMRGELVTWVYNADANGCCWGHYFSPGEYSAAVADYRERGAQFLR